MADHDRINRPLLRRSIVEKSGPSRITEPFVQIPDIIISTQSIEVQDLLSRTVGTINNGDDATVLEEQDEALNR